MNTLEQIVATHPCPIIRAKIMENVDKTQQYQGLFDIVYHGMNWSKTKEGYRFWKTFCGFISATYSDLKHLDNSYTPKPTPPTPKWLPIDRDKLPVEKVAAMHINTPLVFTGILYLCENEGISLEICNGANVHGFTHYIPLSDLLNLPIAE